MKILTINELGFKLPDDFNGSISVALRLLANYLDEDHPHLPAQPGQGTKVRQISPKAWEDFQDVAYRGGRVAGGITLQTLTDGKWVIDQDAGVQNEKN